MDVALVQHAEDDVDHDQRREDQVGLGLQRVLEGLRRALEGAAERLAGMRMVAAVFWIAVHRIAERDVRARG